MSAIPSTSVRSQDTPPRGLSGREWFVFLLALVVAASMIYAAWWSIGWTRLGTKEDPITPSGGAYFFKRVELAVPGFCQFDPRWGNDHLGNTQATLAAEGCALASAAMVLAYYGIDTDPQRLNAFVTEHDGYTPQGWLYWEKAAEISNGTVQHVYEDAPSFALIDRNLLEGNPVIVRVRTRSGGPHFVAIVGKDGFDYLTRDPGGGYKKGIYPLKEFGSNIYALRFYKHLVARQ